MRKINKQLLKQYFNTNGKSAKAKLALEVGVSVSFIEKLAGNKYNSDLKVSVAFRLAESLGVTVENLFLPAGNEKEAA